MRDMEIPAISTEYGSDLFRSRLEARWAIFFNELEIKFKYEPVRFELPSGSYLPDFWLPDQELWIEVKPKHIWEGLDLCAELAQETGCRVYFCNTGILQRMPEDWKMYHPAVLVGLEPKMLFGCTEGEEGRGMRFDFPYLWCECTGCGTLDVQFMGWAGRNSHSSGCCGFSYGKAWYTPRLEAAYRKARYTTFRKKSGYSAVCPQ